MHVYDKARTGRTWALPAFKGCYLLPSPNPSLSAQVPFLHLIFIFPEGGKKKYSCQLEPWVRLLWSWTTRGWLWTCKGKKNKMEIMWQSKQFQNEVY